MCIIVYKPWGIPMDFRTLETCFENNPDGAGYMFPCEGRLLIKKGFFSFDDFSAAWDKSRKIHGDTLPVVFHFRIATAGKIDKANCHPHRIAHDLGFVHNGILSCVDVPKGSEVSDTIIYRDRYLGNLTGYFLRHAKLFKRIGRHIGRGNKFVFMNGRGRVVICNEDQGEWRDGIWFSNLSFLPRRGFPFFRNDGEWVCEYCGRILATEEEMVESACRECLEYFEAGPADCGGCYGILPSSVHRELGWCDDCGFEIYGKDWPNLLRESASLNVGGGGGKWF